MWHRHWSVFHNVLTKCAISSHEFVWKCFIASYKSMLEYSFPFESTQLASFVKLQHVGLTVALTHWTLGQGTCTHLRYCSMFAKRLIKPHRQILGVKWTWFYNCGSTQMMKQHFNLEIMYLFLHIGPSCKDWWLCCFWDFPRAFTLYVWMNWWTLTVPSWHCFHRC